MHDSGKREEFGTGAVRDSSEGKPRPDLISPHAIMREAVWMAKGAKKYGERNWEKGIPIRRCFESMFRHLLMYWLGDRTEDHLAAIRFNAGAIMHFEETTLAGRNSTTEEV